MVPTRSYIVAATPRTGSYLLCEGLEATGVAGRPTEAFSPAFQHIWRSRWSLGSDPGFTEYLQAALRHGTTSNGVYALKLHWMHVHRLASDAGFSGESAGVLKHLFGDSLFVNVVRADRCAQAISYFRALATNEWWRIGGVHNDQVNGKSPIFNADAIRSLEKDLAGQQLAWENFFRERKIKPMVVEYGSLVEDYGRQVGRVLEFLGLDSAPARSLPPPRLVRQSDRTSAHWHELMKTSARDFR